jgi:hypothetical protein
LFKCKVCAEKDRRIADLQEQIKFLRSYQTPSHPTQVEARDLEADSLLSGKNDVIEITGHNIAAETESENVDDVISERDRILTGTY